MLIKRGFYTKPNERFACWLLALVSMLGDLITVISLGYYSSRIRGYMLFNCEWFKNLTKD